jgi:hypothetical protein
MSKLRVMYVLYHYPQISETYIRSEMEAVRDECEFRVVSLHRANTPYAGHEPYVLTDDAEAIRREIRAFRPHVLHTHWLPQLRELGYLAGYFGPAAGEAGIPFTVRAHSFDVLDEGHKLVREAAPLLNSDLCLGVLTFPFTRAIYERAGVRGDKVFDCWPVINYARFHDESPNGPDVMNVGACLPKKRMEDFLRLATLVPHRRFDLYAMGYRSKEIDKLNADMGHPVTIVPPVEPEQMLREYKKHQWLVYTASREMGTVGWSLAVAEAQAAGVGVCFPRLRPDLDEYVGSAGYLYDSIEEVADIVARPFPEERRRLGFEHARKSDVFEHRATLLHLWREAAAGGARPVRARGDDGLPDWGEGDTALERAWRARNLSREIEAFVPAGGTFVEAGDAAEWTGLQAGRRALPFVERDGQYWGLPDSDDAAIAELERMRAAGASALVFRSPNFWWLDHYSGFASHLRARYGPLVENDRIVVFGLADGRRAAAPAPAPAAGA